MITMTKEGRQFLILQTVDSQGEVTVNDLADKLNVSEMTIRRDLIDLDALGLLKRVHGAAISLSKIYQLVDPPIIERVKEQTLAKHRIAQVVAGFIKGNETVFLGSGSTIHAVAKALTKRKNLTVITNALTVCNELVNSPEITLILTGGCLRREEMTFIGYFLENAIRNLRVDKVILGVRGIDPVYGFTSDDMREIITDRALLATSSSIIIAADFTKFGYVGATRAADITAASLIITDIKAPDDIIEKIRKKGVKVIKA